MKPQKIIIEEEKIIINSQIFKLSIYTKSCYKSWYMLDIVYYNSRLESIEVTNETAKDIYFRNLITSEPCYYESEDFLSCYIIKEIVKDKLKNKELKLQKIKGNNYYKGELNKNNIIVYNLVSNL